MSGVTDLLVALMGGSRVFVYTDTVADNAPSPASAFIEYENDGDILAVTALDGSVDVGDWISPKGLAHGGHTIRAHVDSGTLDGASAAVDTDLALSTDRTWGVTQSGVGTNSATITITIKNSGGVAVASGQITLSATATS